MHLSYRGPHVEMVRRGDKASQRVRLDGGGDDIHAIHAVESGDGASALHLDGGAVPDV